MRGVALLMRRFVPLGNDSGADIVNIAVTHFFRSLIRKEFAEGYCRKTAQTTSRLRLRYSIKGRDLANSREVLHLES